MVPISSQWLPVLLSAVIVFFASWLFHMVLPHHKGDFKHVPDEELFLESMRKLGIAPGDYVVPCPSSPHAMKDPAFVERRTRGPNVIMTVMKGSPPSMGKELIQWFLFLLLVGVFAAYITGRALPPGVPYLKVMRFAGATSFLCYGVGAIPGSIWYKRSWGATLKTVADGLVYGLLTGGTFGWLWPR